MLSLLTSMSVDFVLRWVNETVAQLPQRSPLTVNPDVTVSAAIDIMKREGFDQIPVVSHEGCGVFVMFFVLFCSIVIAMQHCAGYDHREQADVQPHPQQVQDNGHRGEAGVQAVQEGVFVEASMHISTHTMHVRWTLRPSSAMSRACLTRTISCSSQRRSAAVCSLCSLRNLKSEVDVGRRLGCRPDCGEDNDFLHCYAHRSAQLHHQQARQVLRAHHTSLLHESKNK